MSIAAGSDPALGTGRPRQRFRKPAQREDWRSAVARTQGVAAFMVFHDKTLTELASRKPADLSQLGTVPGIGPSKLDRYGAALLEVIASIN